jgi:hypothetical protein
MDAREMQLINTFRSKGLGKINRCATSNDAIQNGPSGDYRQMRSVA